MHLALVLSEMHLALVLREMLHALVLREMHIALVLREMHLALVQREMHLALVSREMHLALVHLETGPIFEGFRTLGTGDSISELTQTMLLPHVGPEFRVGNKKPTQKKTPKTT
jgi:hypothetical protein